MSSQLLRDYQLLRFHAAFIAYRHEVNALCPGGDADLNPQVGRLVLSHQLAVDVGDGHHCAFRHFRQRQRGELLGRVRVETDAEGTCTSVFSNAGRCRVRRLRSNAVVQGVGCQYRGLGCTLTTDEVGAVPSQRELDAVLHFNQVERNLVIAWQSPGDFNLVGGVGEEVQIEVVVSVVGRRCECSGRDAAGRARNHLAHISVLIRPVG